MIIFTDIYQTGHCEVRAGAPLGFPDDLGINLARFSKDWAPYSLLFCSRSWSKEGVDLMAGTAVDFHAVETGFPCPHTRPSTQISSIYFFISSCVMARGTAKSGPGQFLLS
jgi:hypothetical protein